MFVKLVAFAVVLIILYHYGLGHPHFENGIINYQYTQLRRFSSNHHSKQYIPKNKNPYEKYEIVKDQYNEYHSYYPGSPRRSKRVKREREPTFWTVFQAFNLFLNVFHTFNDFGNGTTEVDE